MVKSKALVERNWILLYDSVEPLTHPLRTSKEKNHDLAIKLYGLTEKERLEANKRNKESYKRRIR